MKLNKAWYRNSLVPMHWWRSACRSSHPCMHQKRSFVKPGGIPVVYLKRGMERPTIEGNPIIYGKHIEKRRLDPEVAAGDLVVIASSDGREIGKGVYNPHSLYTIRVLVLKSEDTLYHLSFEDLMFYKIRHAQDLRSTMLSLPSKSTTAYRLVNSEGDRLSGLVVDVFEHLIVAKSAALWLEKHRDDVKRAIKGVLGNSVTVSWKQSTSFLNLDGYKSDGMDKLNEDSEVDKAVKGIDIKESGISYHVYPGFGQKTGFFMDQRENRKKIGRLCHGIK